MTDLALTPAVYTLDTTQIDDALARMVHASVKLLFVIDSASHLVGLITAFDIVGEKPLQYLQSVVDHGAARSRSQVLVRNIMQPVQQWRVLDMDEIAHASVGDIVETFKSAAVRHLIVLDDSRAPEAHVRGIFSATQFESALKLELGVIKRATTFAEVEQALGSLPS
jgi:CBS domain-containing protein